MLSGSQGRVLHFVLAQNHDVFQKDIEEEFGLRSPTATQLLKKMEQDGLIRREVMAEDGRLKRILVSEKALQYKDVVITDLINLEEELTKEIPQEEMDIFFRIIEKMMENVS
jgi:DNA-binding MarR family transcriptional regulator